MAKTQTPRLSRRERQIMDILYSLGGAGAAEVREQLPDPPSYSAVRALLRVLEEKGHVRHEQQGPRYLYRPTVPREQARRSALRHLVATFFEGSVTGAVAALLDAEASQLEAADYERLAAMIEQAKKEGR